jgi:hypothetical protein
VRRVLALSQREALKSPLAKLDGIGNAIRSKRRKLEAEGGLEVQIPFEITKRIASLKHHPAGIECLSQGFEGLRIVQIDSGVSRAHVLPSMLLQAGVLGSQPSVPVLLLPAMIDHAPFGVE